MINYRAREAIDRRVVDSARLDRRAEKVPASQLGGRYLFTGIGDGGWGEEREDKEYLQNHSADHGASDGHEVQF